MSGDQGSDNWIANYEAAQKYKHQQFLKAIKYEFIERTTQQRRDRLNEINSQQVQGLPVETSEGGYRPAAAPDNPIVRTAGGRYLRAR